MALTKRGGKRKSNGARVRALLNSNRGGRNNGGGGCCDIGGMMMMKKDSHQSTILKLVLTMFFAVVVASMYRESSDESVGGGITVSHGPTTKPSIRHSSNPTSPSSSSSSSSIDVERYVIDESHGVELVVDLQISPSSSKTRTTTTISGGPHKTTLRVSSSTKLVRCASVSDVKFWLQYEGDAMGTVIMAAASGDTNEWTGDFSFPMSGSYQLVSYYAGCTGDDNAKLSKVVLKDGLVVVVDNTDDDDDDSTNAIRPGEDSLSSKSMVDPYLTSTLFPKAAWVASHKLDYTIDSTTIPYIWHDPSQFAGGGGGGGDDDDDKKLIKTSAASVSKQGATFKETGFYLFHKLSNYELVCWVGSQSASATKEAFMKLRPSIASNQRPFKFHYYNTSSFVHPDSDWVGDSETRFRKCKHLLVSIDEIKNDYDLDGGGNNKPLTQQQYADQVTTFLHHLEKAFPDETFPIWIFTVNESPVTPTNCVAPYYLPRTSHHPCNDVLFDLFSPTDSTTTGTKFSHRVHLLDNTMISLPQSLWRSSRSTSSDNNVETVSNDVVATTIALRIFVFVGRKVQEWRDADQIGLIDGLHRGDNVEPNLKLVPYTGWK